MQNKLQELTDRIYAEGVQKAKDEAQKIIVAAKEQASTIVASAQKEAERILQTAKLEADDHKRNIESEIQIATLQAINALKQQLSELITLQVVQPPMSELFSDKKFIESLILKIIETCSNAENNNLEFIFPEADKERLEHFYKNSLNIQLQKNTEFRFSKQINSGFKVTPKGENYVISFSDTDFTNYLKSYLRPKTFQILFEK